MNPSQYLLSHPKDCGCQSCFARNPQGKTFAFRRHPHVDNCDCSVCWSRRNWQPPKRVASPSTPCTDCRPAQWRMVDGRNCVTAASYCEKHKPSPRPPKFWSVVSDTGKPTPFVPLRESFELVG